MSALELPALLETLQANPAQGLSSGEAERRLQLYRQNVLVEPEPLSFWSRIREQLDNQLVQLLTGASVVNAFLGHLGDAVSILAIVAMNALLGAFQESKAEQSIRALRNMQVPVASVIRDGAEQEIPAAVLVPGDVVLLRSGDKVPADLRLFSEWDLEADESSLTGESYPVAKSSPGERQQCLPVHGHQHHPRACPGRGLCHRHGHPDGADCGHAQGEPTPADTSPTEPGRGGFAHHAVLPGHLRCPGGQRPAAWLAA